MSEQISMGLSFDDVLLVPQKSSILPADADLSSKLTRDLKLNLPILSSAMDTVTESRLAIHLAREGGMGVVHRNCTVKEQANMVRIVKRSENIVIDNPETVSPDCNIGGLKQQLSGSGFSGFPVVDGKGILKGMVTRRDIWFIEDEKLKVKDVMTPLDKLITGEIGYSLEDAKTILYEHRIEKLPLVNKKGKLVGLMTSADIEKRMMYQNACKDESGHLRVGGAVGVAKDSMTRAEALVEAECDALFIDAATGHTDRVIKLIGRLKSKFPETPVVAGNVVTRDGAADLIDAGADAIKAGVGPGSICTTRVVAGVGVPQFTAIQNAAEACKEKDVPLIADGGLRYSGDVIKALAAGADCVMIGSLFAGTEESPGSTVRWQGRAYKEYRGMGSVSAMRAGASDRYGQNASGKLVPEGVEARVPYKGPIHALIYQLMGGVRSGMGYVGAKNIADLQAKARFVRITDGGLKESHPHDITITEEPINYPSM
ncbi:MAG: IMP dehydrogenase [Verrucomicrobiota bacterium]